MVQEEVHESRIVHTEVTADAHMVSDRHIVIALVGQEQVAVPAGYLHPLHIRHRPAPGILPGEDEAEVLGAFSVI